jgi:hypothetical protein
MDRRRVLLVLLPLACLVAAGCGARNSDPYTAKGTVSCLQKKGFAVTVAPAKVGFIARYAANGGLLATAPDGNVLTVAFTADTDAVRATTRAFRRFAPAKLRPRMNDIMETERNAVLVWTVSPTPEQLSDAKSCLSP